MEEVLKRIEESEKAGNQSPHLKTAKEARTRWGRILDLIRRSRRALLAFEAWNLFVIGVSLVAFNYVKPLASSSWAFWGVWVAAVGTVAVTFYSVFAWTRE